jgi:hypothetical protein
MVVFDTILERIAILMPEEFYEETGGSFCNIISKL